MPKAVVVNPYFDWGNDRPPRIPYHESVIYEAHVKGMTRRHPDIPEELRGTYAGIAHPAIIDHLTQLGVTAIELMPVHQFIHDNRLVDLGLRNYWGYNTIGFFAPYHGYAAMGRLGQQVQEFRGMVQVAARGRHRGHPRRGLQPHRRGQPPRPDARLQGHRQRRATTGCRRGPQYYVDYTGTGNCLNMRSPHSLQLIMDSLRYWVQEMHVDGFRFDLAATLAREFYEVDRLSTFFEVVQQDPVVSQVKLIAEPWDIGPGGYQVGNFPPLWTEWNGKFRDTVRDFWRGEPATLAEFARRISGSADLYQDDGRSRSTASTSSPATTGSRSTTWCPTTTSTTRPTARRTATARATTGRGTAASRGRPTTPACSRCAPASAATSSPRCCSSQGVPMIGHGDELGRTQRGNNNAYCQDNEVAWVDWDNVDEQLLDFVRRLTAFRARHRVFRRRRFFTGSNVQTRTVGAPLPDLAWFTPDGRRDERHRTGATTSAGRSALRQRRGHPERGQYGQRHLDDSFLLCFNAHDAGSTSRCRPHEYGQKWERVITTAEPGPDDQRVVEAGGSIAVADKSLVVLDRTV